MVKQTTMYASGTPTRARNWLQLMPNHRCGSTDQAYSVAILFIIDFDRQSPVQLDLPLVPGFQASLLQQSSNFRSPHSFGIHMTKRFSEALGRSSFACGAGLPATI